MAVTQGQLVNSHKFVKAHPKDEAEGQANAYKLSEVGVTWDSKKFKAEAEKIIQEIAMARLAATLSTSTVADTAYLKLTCGAVEFEKDQLGNHKRDQKGQLIARWKIVSGRSSAKEREYDEAESKVNARRLVDKIIEIFNKTMEGQDDKESATPLQISLRDFLNEFEEKFSAVKRLV